MRLLVTASLALWVAAVAAQAPQKPANHPEAPSTSGRAEASALTEKLRPSSGAGAMAAVPRRNFIDDYIFSKMERDGIPHAPLASDEEFFRRVHIDLTGRIGSDEELRRFVASTDPDKRDKLIDRLVTTQPYKAKWTYFFNDIFKPHANRVGVQGKVVFTRWVYDNIHLDRPYNEMVQEMLTASAISNWYVGPASYVARWVITAVACDDEVHEDTSEEVAIHAAKDFLGIDLTCISCHDGARHLEKINVDLAKRKRSELWQMAAFFGKTRVLRRSEVNTGQDEYSVDDKGPGFDAGGRTVLRTERRGKGMVEPVYIFTGERPDPSKNPRHEFARMLTSDPQFARATVNLLWSEMFGVGIVDPPFSWDLARLDPDNLPEGWTLQPTHPELLDALAKYFVENNYSLRSVISLIAKSSAYQLSSRFPGEWKPSYAPYFARKFVRRLKAEEIHDSLVTATGIQPEYPIRGTDIRVRFAHDAGPEDFGQFFARRDDVNAKEVHFFLSAFGQTNRESSERSNDGEITQAILLMNSPFVLKQIQAAENSYLAGLLKQDLPADEKVARLFQRFLMRTPTAEELAQARRVVAAENGVKGWEDLQWLLVNKVEFVHNF
ncbi:MAG TPA: DUF1553 domain-containing protein [Vicinamibacterales bacterium]|nr:DUF1553 domain-containing protein [Vicinamibacterales bacterium]